MSRPNQLKINYMPTGELKDYHRQFRKPGKKQIQKTIAMIEQCGIVTPIVIDGENRIVIGGHIVQAARQMNVDTLPVVNVNHLEEYQIRTLRIAYDRIAEEAEWDKNELRLEFEDLEILMPDIDLTLTGFDIPEIEVILDETPENDPDDEAPEPEAGQATVQAGELWQCGDHLLYCGNALEADSYTTLLGEDTVDLVFTDAPYNVKIDGHVGNSGKIKHREFEMASGEMSQQEFTTFLTTVHQHMADHIKDGGILFSCMDWRHITEITMAASSAGLNMLNLCIWNKDNGGMGSLYRSKHELIFVFKKGKGSHTNNVELGKHGRYRTNVWEYPGVNSFARNRRDDLKLHPTVKPVSMVADAIKDCSKRGHTVLDPFGGSGTTMIAAERSGRKARIIELDPLYCDVIVKRWQSISKSDAVRVSDGMTFNQLANTAGEK